MQTHRISASLLALTLAGGAAPSVLLAESAAATPGDASKVGRFAAAFEQAGAKCTKDKDAKSRCKPAAASVMVLPTGKYYYWDALEGSEDVRYNQVAEYGTTAQNDTSRVLTLGAGDRPSWVTPSLATSGSNLNGNPNAEYLPVVPHNDAKNSGNDGDLFCSDQLFLADGRVLDAGGTAYYSEPSVPGTNYGVVELEGLKNGRIFDPANLSWKQTGQMAYGRWYPSLVNLPNGQVFVASGVTKLIKPAYPNRPGDSGTNVLQTETYNPATGRWTYNGKGADKDLPLFPRLHLLPDGHVYFDAGGQTFNPDGQSTGEAGWNMAASYNPATKTWTNLGLPQFGNGLVGFRGSAFSQLLPLKAPYNHVDVLSAGGVYGVSPGTYLGTATATINSVALRGGTETFSSKAVAPMKAARWYGSGVTLPTGQVLVFNGANRDEVVLPGSADPVTVPELYDPATDTWTELASQSHGRTYHNTASLMPDGRVLVAGHAPINTGYAYQTDALHDAVGFSETFRDPSMEIYSPPNLFYGARPVITKWSESVARGKTMTIGTTDAAEVGSVVLVRNTAITHLVDGDQRTVELPVVARTPKSVTVAVTGNAAVLPSGPYMLFVNKKTAKGLTPSVSRQVFVGRSVPGPLAKAVSSTNRSRLAAELAALGAASSTAPAAGPGTAGRAALQGRSATSTASVAAPVARRLPAPSAKGVAFDPVALIGRELQLPLWPAVGLLALAMALAGVWRQSTRSEAGRIPPKGS